MAWMFERTGMFLVPGRQTTEDALMELAIEAGASDVRSTGDAFEIITTPDAYQQVAEALEAAKITTEAAELAMVPTTTVELDDDLGRQVMKFMEALEDNEDVQNVTGNFNIPSSVLAEMAG